jgi:pSer/pThr/pTyr-binding forkhead associated (FHA) protein
VKLRITRQNKPSRTYDVDESTFLIGSEPDCGIFLPEERISGRHAILSTRSADFWIEDLQSDHGTFINGARIQGRAGFARGDVIRVASVEIVALPDGGAVDPPHVEEAPPPAASAQAPARREKRAPEATPPPPTRSVCRSQARHQAASP